MPSLKDIKNQINSVGSTKKITSAMKMVAASKLRRSQEKAEAARPYSSRLEEMLVSLASSAASGEGIIKLLTGTGNDSYINLKMDFDPDTKLLHVGSGQGKSDFSGLQRINSTTNPVNIAVSASGGIIAEA